MEDSYWQVCFGLWNGLVNKIAGLSFSEPIMIYIKKFHHAVSHSQATVS